MSNLATTTTTTTTTPAYDLNSIKATLIALGKTGASRLNSALQELDKVTRPEDKQNLITVLLSEPSSKDLGVKLDLYVTNHAMLASLDDSAKVSVLGALYTLKGKGFVATLAKI